MRSEDDEYQIKTKKIPKVQRNINVEKEVKKRRKLVRTGYEDKTNRRKAKNAAASKG